MLWGFYSWKVSKAAPDSKAHSNVNTPVKDSVSRSQRLEGDAIPSSHSKCRVRDCIPLSGLDSLRDGWPDCIWGVRQHVTLQGFKGWGEGISRSCLGKSHVICSLFNSDRIPPSLSLLNVFLFLTAQSCRHWVLSQAAWTEEAPIAVYF